MTALYASLIKSVQFLPYNNCNCVLLKECLKFPEKAAAYYNKMFRVFQQKSGMVKSHTILLLFAKCTFDNCHEMNITNLYKDQNRRGSKCANVGLDLRRHFLLK